MKQLRTARRYLTPRRSRSGVSNLTVDVEPWTALSGERLLATEAMRLLMRLDSDLRDAHVDWNEDRFRRVMRARKRAVVSLQRRWEKVEASACNSLGKLRRRRSANIARYFIISEPT
jgi:hypothetical protein